MAGKLLDVATVAGLKLDEQFVSFADAFGERPVSHGAGDLDFSALVGEVEHLAPNDDAGDIFAVIGLTLRHKLLPSTERRDIEPCVVTKINPVTVSGRLTSRSFDRYDFAGPAAPCPGDSGRIGEAGEKVVRGYGELKHLTSGADVEAADTAFHPTADRLFDKNDSIFHALHSPRTAERGREWVPESVCEINSLTKHKLFSRRCAEAA